MPQQITTTKTVFTYAELTDTARERAREWYIEGLNYEWWDGVVEDAKTTGALFGLSIENVYFSGFWSQGDGACFEGSYSYKRGGVRAVTDRTGDSDKTLLGIVKGLQDVQRPHFYGLTATVKQSGHYSHEFCTRIAVCDRDGYDADADTDEAVSGLLRNYMRWIYRNLEREYEYLCSEEQCAESCEANGYLFDEDGRPA